MKERHEKYKEILLLEHFLQEKGIPYHTEKLYDGYRIEVPDPGFNRTAKRLSIIEHQSSYGSAFDMLEIQDPSGVIRGFLKADTAMEMIEEYLRSIL